MPTGQLRKKKEDADKSYLGETAVDEQSQGLFSPGKHIDSPEELKKLLDEAGVKHSQGYFHYTTIDKCRKIFAGGKFFLSHAAYMNDKLEA
ncbi:MAG: hypothetical protein IJI36_07055, partial [Kiritimatiellae bacterium]|nr:hypothetical protein [Kiritimatiellia bacterium]